MGIRLGNARYGKAETRLVRVTREGSTHHLKDLNVSVALEGDFDDAYRRGDNTRVVPTDTQRGTIFAFAREAPVGEIEEFGLRLAHHFAGLEPVHRARVAIEERPWARVSVQGEPHPHTFVRQGEELRLATVTCASGRTWVVAGLRDLVLLKSAGSEFRGYFRDRYTTLEEASERILATSVTARWRYAHLEVDWGQAHAEARRLMVETFAARHSLSLQQTLYDMGKAVLEGRPEVAEVRLEMPNQHHFVVDLSPYGLDNRNQVFHAADRPYGLIEGTVVRDGAPEPGLAW